ncbi:hypothetical protein U1Q18_037145 [Sarracenia purpurea var. burkii]
MTMPRKAPTAPRLESHHRISFPATSPARKSRNDNGSPMGGGEISGKGDQFHGKGEIAESQDKRSNSLLEFSKQNQAKGSDMGFGLLDGPQSYKNPFSPNNANLVTLKRAYLI